MDGVRKVEMWYDPDGDYMEVTFEEKAGYFRETEDDWVMERVDAEGDVLSFSVLGVSSVKQGSIEISLLS